MSLFVWNIHIEGNFTRTDEVILEFLESKHIEHGMLKKKVNCERIVKDIRKEFDDIVWVSAYVTGTRLMIQVKENTDTFPMELQKKSRRMTLWPRRTDGLRVSSQEMEFLLSSRAMK